MALLAVVTLVLVHFSFIPILVVLLESSLVYYNEEYDDISGNETEKS
jgi:hypothetical protein